MQSDPGRVRSAPGNRLDTFRIPSWSSRASPRVPVYPVRGEPRTRSRNTRTSSRVLSILGPWVDSSTQGFSVVLPGNFLVRSPSPHPGGSVGCSELSFSFEDQGFVPVRFRGGRKLFFTGECTAKGSAKWRGRPEATVLDRVRTRNPDVAGFWSWVYVGHGKSVYARDLGQILVYPSPGPIVRLVDNKRESNLWSAAGRS